MMLPCHSNGVCHHCDDCRMQKESKGGGMNIDYAGEMNRKQAYEWLLSGNKLEYGPEDSEYIFMDEKGLILDDELSAVSLNDNDRYFPYEEKPKLEKDPYVGKQIIHKNRELKDILFVNRCVVSGHKYKAYVIDGWGQASEDCLLETFYIEGIDF